jgi:hypothetical protein
VTVLRHPPSSSGTFLHALRPAHLVVLLIVTTTIVRVIFAANLGLGIDESYAVATGRAPQLSYFDHPPLSWWLPWASAQLLGTEAPLAVRLPFIAASQYGCIKRREASTGSTTARRLRMFLANSNTRTR